MINRDNAGDLDSLIASNSATNLKFSFRKLWQFTGPGFLMSIAYLDPGNLESDLQSGAIAGYKLLWALLYSTIIGFILQMLAVRLGATTGLHLAQVCHKEYGTVSRYFLWIMIEIAIICSDIQQVIGSALAINILSHNYISISVAILITAADTFIFLLIENTGLRVLEAIFGIFITIMSATFLHIYIRVQPDQNEIIKGVLYPWCSNCSYKEIRQLVGIMGSIIMPHNLYFHSTLVLSRNIDRRHERAVKEANKYYAIESAIALFISFLCNLFVMSTFSKIFHDTPMAANVSLANVGPYISSEYGMATLIIWGIGLLSAGQCSTMTVTYAGQFVMEGFTKINLPKWQRILITRSLSIIPAMVISIIAIDNMDLLNFWCNIIQSIQLPFALLPILHFTASRRIMGNFKTNKLTQAFCYLVAIAVITINLYILVTIIIHTENLYLYLLFAFIALIYLMVVIYYMLGVNNIYRFKAFLRRIFCMPYASEIDEILHATPAYRRPQKSNPLLSESINQNYASFSASVNDTRTHRQSIALNYDPPEPVIA